MTGICTEFLYEGVKVGSDELSGSLQVRCGDRHQLLPDNPERFDRVVCILGREMISSGRHYWEVRGSDLTCECVFCFGLVNVTGQSNKTD